MIRSGNNGWAFRAGIALAVVTSLLIVWTTIVRDSTAEAHFMLILAAGVGSFAAMLQAAGMARTMVGVAVMQAALGFLIATAPSTSSLPGEPMKGLLFSGGFSLLWLVSAAFFRVADRSIRQTGAGERSAQAVS